MNFLLVMADWATQTYGTDVINSSMKFIIEYFGYILASLIGALCKEFIVQDERVDWRKMVAFAFFSATILLVFGNQLKEVLGDPRYIFGVSVFSGFLAPSLSSSIKSGKLGKDILMFLKGTLSGFIDVIIKNITIKKDKD